VRRFLTWIAIVVAALGLLWLVRLVRTQSSDGPQRRSAEDARALPSALPAALPSSVTTPQPATVLGRIGGKLPEVLIDPRIVVEKSRRTLTVFSDEHPVKTYRIALGLLPTGAKQREGDLKTPEGTFYICSKNAESRYHLSVGLSYPNRDDAERGLAAGLITKRERRTIVEAIAHYRKPPWNTKLGGEIMIHGGGVGQDWTTGCIALDDSDIDEFFSRVPLGTRVEIRP